MPGTLRLLFLEDDPIDVEITVATLREAGYDCQWERAETREEFISCLAEPHYDLILSDYSLPRFDVLTALAYVLDQKLAIPFILLSGQMEKEKVDEVFEAGATDCLPKNNLSSLISLVKELIPE